MQTLCAALILASAIVLVPLRTFGQDYDGCNEQFYDPVDEPCGGGHQHAAGKRDEGSLERARHRHRHLEDQIKQLAQKVATLSAEVEQLKRPGTK